MKSLIQIFRIILFSLVLSSCTDSGGETIEPSLDTPIFVQGGETYLYKDSSEFEGQPVYSLAQGVSQAAHEAFIACGLDDETIESLVDSYLEHGSETHILVAGDLKSEPEWEVVMTVTPLTSDIYLVACSGEKTT